MVGKIFKFMVEVASMSESKDRINTQNFLDPKIPFLYSKKKNWGQYEEMFTTVRFSVEGSQVFVLLVFELFFKMFKIKITS